MIGYELIDKPARVYAIDGDGVEICGARQPYGHDCYVFYATARIEENPHHQVIALTREAAVEHVKMFADLYAQATRSGAVAEIEETA